MPLDRLDEALSVLLATPSGRAPPEQRAAFIQSAIARGMNLERIRVARRGRHILYAAMANVLPGRTLMLISGTPTSDAAADAAIVVIDEVVGQYASADLCLMQVLLESQDALLRGVYELCGFHVLAQLVYLEGPGRQQPWHLPGPDWNIICYSQARHAEFARAIEQSYQQTLDCPGLSGVRDIEDVIVGHKASGEFDPRNWIVVRQGEKAAGVLLLARTPASDALELVYIGLCPWARGRGLGGELMKLALSRVTEMGCARLSTAADSQNIPAMRLYARHGMRAIGSRIAMIRTYPQRGGSSSTIRSQFA